MIDRLSKEQQELFFLIAEKAAPARVALVGGAVRDLWLGESPNDLDIVIESDAIEQIAQSLEWPYRFQPLFKNATLTIHSLSVDLIRARTETYPRAGCAPLPQSGTIEEDLLRRDFSINAMALLTDGALLDITNGEADLQQKILRPLYQQSFYEDASRLVRGARLMVRLNLSVSQAFEAQIPDALQMMLVTPRFWQEIKLIFTEEQPSLIIQQLRDWGVSLPKADILSHHEAVVHDPNERLFLWLNSSDDPLRWAQQIGISQKKWRFLRTMG